MGRQGVRASDPGDAQHREEASSIDVSAGKGQSPFMLNGLFSLGVKKKVKKMDPHLFLCSLASELRAWCKSLSHCILISASSPRNSKLWAYSVYWHREPVSHQFNEVTLHQRMTGKYSLIWTFILFFTSKWTYFILQHGGQACYLFDIGFSNIPAGPGLSRVRFTHTQWHWHLPLLRLPLSCWLVYLKQTVPGQSLECTWMWCLLDIYTLAVLGSSVIPAQGLSQQALCCI